MKNFLHLGNKPISKHYFNLKKKLPSYLRKTLIYFSAPISKNTLWNSFYLVKYVLTGFGGLLIARAIRRASHVSYPQKTAEIIYNNVAAPSPHNSISIPSVTRLENFFRIWG